MWQEMAERQNDYVDRSFMLDFIEGNERESPKEIQCNHHKMISN